MTKRELHKNINVRVYQFIESLTSPKFEIDSTEGYGRIYFRPLNEFNEYIIDGEIEYHQSRHDVCMYPGLAPKLMKDIFNEIETHINQIVAEETEKYTVSSASSPIHPIFQEALKPFMP
jgi:hypothetical protein